MTPYLYHTIPTDCWDEFRLYLLGKTHADHLLVEIKIIHQSEISYVLCRDGNTIFTLNELTGLEKIEDIQYINYINLGDGSFYLCRAHNHTYQHTPFKTFSTFIDLRRELNALMIEERL